MWLDIVALVILGSFAGIGALRGALVAGLALASLCVAYAAALLAAPRAGPWVAELTGTSEWIGMPLAGSAAFLLAFLGMGLVSTLLRRANALEPGTARSPRDRFLGGVFGAIRGGLVVLLLSYLAIWVDALRTTGTAPDLPEFGPSAALNVTESIVETGIGAIVDDSAPGGRMLARVAARPGASLAEFEQLLQHPVIMELRSDELFWSYVEYGNVDAALSRRGALALVYDADIRRQLGALGLIDAAAEADSAVFRAQIADVLRAVGPRIRGLKEDPELQALMRDPAVVAAVQDGDHFALIGHPGIRSVVARALEGE